MVQGSFIKPEWRGDIINKPVCTIPIRGPLLSPSTPLRSSSGMGRRWSPGRLSTLRPTPSWTSWRRQDMLSFHLENCSPQKVGLVFKGRNFNCLINDTIKGFLGTPCSSVIFLSPGFWRGGGGGGIWGGVTMWRNEICFIMKISPGLKSKNYLKNPVGPSPSSTTSSTARSPSWNHPQI